MQTQKITLDFCQNDYKTVTVKQYDKDSRNLIITCTDNGAFYKLNSSTLQCNVKMNTPDDRAIYDTATIKEDGTVLVTFSESMVYASGTGKLEIQFLDSSTQRSISTMILTVIIVGSVYPDDKIIASDEFSALTDALLKIESDVNAADEAIERINEYVNKIRSRAKKIDVEIKKYSTLIGKNCNHHILIDKIFVYECPICKMSYKYSEGLPKTTKYIISNFEEENEFAIIDEIVLNSLNEEKAENQLLSCFSDLQYSQNVKIRRLTK